jgi:putative ABC transport system permease protein
MNDRAKKNETMNWLRRIRRSIQGLFQKGKLHAEMDEEMRSHIEMQAREHIEAGMEAEEARCAAFREFGGLEAIKETCREQRGTLWLEQALQDLRYGWRTLWKSPGFTAVAVLTLTLGIGGTTAIFSVVNTVIFNPVPGPEPDRLVQIDEPTYSTRDRKPYFGGVSPLVLEALRANADYFSDFAMCRFTVLQRKTEDFTDKHSGALVSANFFRLLGVPPMLGRTLAQDEAVPLDRNQFPARDSVILLSYAWWKSLFHSDPAVVGKTVELSGRQFTVVGVMPPQFQFPSGSTLFWVPAEDPRHEANTMSVPCISVLARLKQGVSGQQAQAMLDALAQRLVQDNANTWGYPDEWRTRPGGLRLWTRPVRLAFHDSYGSEDLRRTLFGLLAAIGFVLLIVCANVANLTLVRTEQRQQELSVRSALGADPIRLLRQLLTESALLVGLGGLGGLLVGVWGMKLLVTLIPESMPRLKAIQLDGQVMGIALVVSAVTGLLFGLAPAWHAGKARLGEALKQAGSGATAGAGRSRFRGTLAVVQVALALVLLSGAGLMIESVIRLLHVNPGYDPENLLRVQVLLPSERYDSHREQSNLLLEGLHASLTSLPGVKAVGIDQQSHSERFKVGDWPEAVDLFPNKCGVEGSDLFRAMRVPLLAGRHLNKSDIADDYFYKLELVEGTSAVVVNETMSRLCWPGRNPIGKTFRAEDPRCKRRYEVVGVVGDIRDFRYDQAVKATFYRPYQEFDLTGQSPDFVIRTAVKPSTLIPAIRRELKAAEPAMNTPRISVVRQTLYDATQAQRAYMLFLVVFAGVGLLLEAVGIYGVLACSVARRRREIGIRMALGAQRGDVLRMVIVEGARLVLVGVGAGLLAAFWLTRLLRSQLFEVSPADPVVMAAVVLVLAAVALLACYIPARRAMNTDPMTILRYE